MKFDPAKPPASDRHVRLAIGKPLKVDAATGLMSDLSLITANREAKGHGFWIDERTLTTALDVVKARGGRLKGYRTHEHGGPGSGAWYAEPGSELDVAGFFGSIAIKGEQLVAGSFEFYDSYKASSPDEYARLLEMAAKTPDLLALSIEPWGYLVYVAEDGTEYSQRPEEVALKYEGMPALRVTELWAAAFCSDGAANDGLFAKLSAFAGKQNPLAAFLAAFFADGKASRETAGHLPALNTPPSISQNKPADKSDMKIILALQTKFAADPKRLAAAMAVVGQTAADKLEGLTVEQVEEALRTGDLADVRAQLTAANNELTTLRTSLATAQQEAADWKDKFEKLKGSGQEKDVNLGAGAGAGGSNADMPNPWAPDTRNLSDQARITKSNPTLAATLKAAAKNLKPAKK